MVVSGRRRWIDVDSQNLFRETTNGSFPIKDTDDTVWHGESLHPCSSILNRDGVIIVSHSVVWKAPNIVLAKNPFRVYTVSITKFIYLFLQYRDHQTIRFSFLHFESSHSSTMQSFRS